MEYIKLEYHESSFEQYEPSCVRLEFEKKFFDLSPSERVKILRMSRDRLSNQLEVEIERNTIDKYKGK